MTIFNLLTMIGGLALFLYGMHVLGDALKEASGGRLEKVLEKLTSNKWKGALLGILVTAVIQSSGATAVMVIGLVNSGIMNLSQSVGVVLGANVGTTVTAWLLSLTGISGGNVFLSLLKPANFSPVVAFIGVILLMVGKKEKHRTIGTIMVGFAVLMIGMDMMSEAFSPLADDPAFTGILTAFAHSPVLGLLAGLAVTVVLQSSSASVGILQAISMSGQVSYGVGIPVIMGANIGSAVTPLIGAMGSNRNAKRAAWFQMIYCLLKTLVFMVVFYAIHGIVNFAFMSHPMGPVTIAIFHSLFNIAALILTLPVSDLLLKLVMKLIPTTPAEMEESHRIQILDDRFLRSPSFALEQCKTAADEMAGYSLEALELSMDLVREFDPDKAARVDRLERMVDEYEDQLDSYLVKLGHGNLTLKDSHTLSVLLHCVGDFERITDHALNIMQSARDMYEKDIVFSAKAMKEMEVFGAAVQQIMNMTVTAFREGDRVLARQVEPLEEVIDDLNLEEKDRHIRRLRKGQCSIESGFTLADITTNYERVADHCSNIAIALLQIEEDAYDAHEYLEHLRSSDSASFQDQMDRYRQQYAFPRAKGEDSQEEPSDLRGEGSEVVDKPKKSKDKKEKKSK